MIHWVLASFAVLRWWCLLVIFTIFFLLIFKTTPAYFQLQSIVKVKEPLRILNMPAQSGTRLSFIRQKVGRCKDAYQPLTKYHNMDLRIIINLIFLEHGVTLYTIIRFQQPRGYLQMWCQSITWFHREKCLLGLPTPHHLSSGSVLKTDFYFLTNHGSPLYSNSQNTEFAFLLDYFTTEFEADMEYFSRPAGLLILNLRIQSSFSPLRKCNVYKCMYLCTTWLSGKLYFMWFTATQCNSEPTHPTFNISNKTSNRYKPKMMLTPGTHRREQTACTLLYLLIVNPGWSKGFLELSKPNNVNINKFYYFISLCRAARSVTNNLFHNPIIGKRKKIYLANSCIFI